MFNFIFTVKRIVLVNCVYGLIIEFNDEVDASIRQLFNKRDRERSAHIDDVFDEVRQREFRSVLLNVHVISIEAKNTPSVRYGKMCA